MTKQESSLVKTILKLRSALLIRIYKVLDHFGATRNQIVYQTAFAGQSL